MPPEKSFDLSTVKLPISQRSNAESTVGEYPSFLRQPLKLYASISLTLALLAGGLLVLSGHIALGKGLILGALFSILNFGLMAIALPLRIGHGRGASTLISLASIAVRYTLMAVPLVIAINYSQFSISSTVIGLFMVQLAIFLNQAWAGGRNLLGAEK